LRMTMAAAVATWGAATATVAAAAYCTIPGRLYSSCSSITSAVMDQRVSVRDSRGQRYCQAGRPHICRGVRGVRRRRRGSERSWLG
jgi:hypothetical protein